jgi:hypothetical protein
MSKFYIIKIHSLVDMITNSSSVIYTYSNNSVDACKKMINELLNVLGSNQTCDDMFYVFCTVEISQLIDYIDDTYDDTDDDDIPEGWYETNKLPYKNCRDAKQKLIWDIFNKIATKTITKPNWLHRAESKENSNGFGPETYLYLLPKDEKYATVANSIVNFLYSTGHESDFDG